MKLDTLNVRVYDLQHDFYTAIIESRADVGDYYWDQVHYVEKGYRLTADVLHRYLVREWLEGD